MTDHALSLWHPFTHEGVDPAPLEIIRGEGVFLETRDGRRILDAISSWWVNLHGHSHPAIAAAIAENAARLENVLFAGFSHEPAEELAERFWQNRSFSAFARFFLGRWIDRSGSSSQDVHPILEQLRPSGKARDRCARTHAYHGDTVGAMSVSDDSPFTAAFDSMRIPVLRTHSASCARCPVGLTRATLPHRMPQQTRTPFG